MLGLDDEFLFLSLAHHSMQKNTFGLVSAFDELVRPHRFAQLVICGRVDDSDYARQVIALRDRSSSSARIHLVGGAREQLLDGPPRGALVANPLGDPLAVGWESMARARFAPQPNWAELVAAMHAFVRDETEIATAEEISADARDRFSADRCLDLHAHAIRAVVAGVPLSGLSARI